SDESSDLENDIAALLHQNDSYFEFAFTSGNEDYIVITDDYGEVILCKSWIKKNWEKTKKFAKKHKKEILIGAAVVVATAVIVVAVVATCSAGAAAAAAGAAGAAASSGSGNKPVPKEPSSPHEIINEAPTLKAAIDEHVASFKEFAAEDVIIQSTDVYRDPTFGEKARNLGSILAHETLDGISEVASAIPQLGEELKSLGSRFLPENMLPSTENPFMRSPTVNHDNLDAKGHQLIDQVFSTDQAEQYTADAKAHNPMNDFTIGLLPPPGKFSKGLNTSKFREIVEVGKETVVLAEDLGFTAREIAQLEKSASLEKTIGNTFENLVCKPALQESYQVFKRAEDVVKPYLGKYMAESQIRELIHEAGIRTFPRPKGIPENFRVKISNKGVGIKYVHPENEHISIRVMPGKPHSPFLYQQQPYVIQKIHGQAVDKFGNYIPSSDPSAHIPFNEYIYKGN
ncbi:MAG: hypothetical protein K1000chlam2_00245, partial [Chlamydiae bacterium]|nr:hypothetical protein [Chlamydiota bacterium]